MTPEGLAVAGRQELLMTDFGIKPPSFMLGTLKTHNRIAVRFAQSGALGAEQVEWMRPGELDVFSTNALTGEDIGELGR